VFLKKVKLISHAFFEVIPKINIKVFDWIVGDLRKFPQSLLGFFNEAHWRPNVFITYLKQDRTADFGGEFEWSVFV